MTLLNFIPLKGLAWDSNKNIWKTAKIWYVLTIDKEIHAIADFKASKDSYGFTILKDKLLAEKISGYLRELDDIKIYKHQLCLTKRL